MLASNIQLLNYQFDQLYFFLGFGFLIFIFNYWLEAKKDGFFEEKGFDFLFSLITFLVVSIFVFDYVIRFLFVDLRLTKITQSDIAFGSYFVSIVTTYAFAHRLAKIYKWSFFRLTDILSLSFVWLPISYFCAQYFFSRDVFLLAYIAVLLLSHYLFSNIRNVLLRSGYTFTLLNIIMILVILTYVNDAYSLIFYGIFLTISIANFYLRKRTNMLNTNFIDLIKQKLLNKEKRITAEQKLLISEDPYMNPGRDTDNAEEMDDAVLEDGAKEVLDRRTDALAAVKVQVRKALAKIKLGKYGICENCGKNIEIARLEAYPEATTCVSCSSKLNK